MSTLYLVRGLPGSGKSTFAKNQFKGVFHVENDMFHMIPESFATCAYKFTDSLRVERSMLCFKMAMKILNCDIPVVVSNVFATKESVDRYQKAALLGNHNVVVFRMKSQFNNQHDVPEDTLKWMKENFVDIVGEHLVTPSSNTGTYFIA